MRGLCAVVSLRHPPRRERPASFKARGAKPRRATRRIGCSPMSLHPYLTVHSLLTCLAVCGRLAVCGKLGMESCSVLRFYFGELQ